MQFHQKRNIASWCKFIFKNTASLNSSNSTLFVDIGIPSRYNFSVTKCHTMATRWLCEGLAKSCSHRKTIGKHRVAIVLPSCGEQTRYRRWPHEVKTMATRTHRMSIRWSHDGHTVDEKDTRSIHEDAPSGRPSAIFWHAKDFVNTPEVAAEPQKTQPAVTRWLRMQSRMTRCLHDHSRCCKFPSSCVHHEQTSGQCDACITDIRERQSCHSVVGATVNASFFCNCS